MAEERYYNIGDRVVVINDPSGDNRGVGKVGRVYDIVDQGEYFDYLIGVIFNPEFEEYDQHWVKGEDLDYA